MQKKELTDVICEEFGITKTTPLIDKQINKFVQQHGYSFKQIARAVFYFVEVQHETPQLKYGIGIVPYIMRESEEYFAELKAKEDRQKKAAEKEEDREVIVYKPCDINKKRKTRMINIEDL